ncbi:MAG TPA: endo-1,4-beta-xylanase [Terriglobales bacterium]|jgi:endo-1,4-beta-xylanase|nr:endo-1,4-beta-xylanase [Terriglobales bacterium]
MLCRRTVNVSARTRRHTPLLTLAFLALLTCGSAIAQVITADFEDQTTDGFTPFGSPTLAVSNVQANTGSFSLLTTSRTATFMGPGMDVTKFLSAGQPYLFKVFVRLSDNTPSAGDTVRLTMKSIIGGSQSFNQVGVATVSNTGWTVLQGTYTPPASFNPPPSGTDNLFVYVEDDSNANAEYYIDTFTVSSVSGGCTTPPDNSGLFSDFEDGTLQGWSTRFNLNMVTNTTADAHTGSRSLIVTGRTANFEGPARDITGKMCNGSQYWLEVWVKMAPGQPTTSVNLSLQLTDATGALSFPSVTTATVDSNSWVRLKAKPYTFSGAYTNLVFYLQTNNNPTAQFYIDDAKIQFLPPPVIENIPSIAQTYSGDFLVGFAAGQQDLTGSHGQLAALHYNSVTPGNDLKWDTTEPTQGNFNFAPADNILTFAQAHNIKMRGHTFVWHNQVPAWVFQDAGGVDMSTEPFSQANKQLLLSRLQNHINALINHYQGSIYVWDVVNEAIDESQPDGFRRTKWYTITQDPSLPSGTPPEFMDDAFIYARQALDTAGFDRTQVKLCYNDFNTTIPAKRQFIFNWVQGAIARGVPIDCVGNQFHNTINFPIDDQGSANSKQGVIDTLNHFASLTSTAGVPIINEVTEFDVSMYRFGNCSQTFYSDYDDLTAGDTVDLINEGYRYRDYFQIFKSLKNEIDSVTIWGLGDDDSWLNPHSNAAGCPGVTVADAPLPFDSGLQHKFAYTGIVNPLALPGANLLTTVAASPGTVGSGKLETFVATVDNQGPNDAANLTFTEQVPSTTLLRAFAAPAGWSCTVPAFMTSGTVTCTTSSLTNGSSAQFTLTVKTSCPVGKLTDTATVSSTTLNPNPTPQNTGSVNFVVVNSGTKSPQICSN